jgi:hypothetical protein
MIYVDIDYLSKNVVFRTPSDLWWIAPQGLQGKTDRTRRAPISVRRESPRPQPPAPAPPEAEGELEPLLPKFTCQSCHVLHWTGISTGKWCFAGGPIMPFAWWLPLCSRMPHRWSTLSCNLRSHDFRGQRQRCTARVFASNLWCGRFFAYDRVAMISLTAFLGRRWASVMIYYLHLFTLDRRFIDIRWRCITQLWLIPFLFAFLLDQHGSFRKLGISELERILRSAEPPLKDPAKWSAAKSQGETNTQSICS